MASIAPVPTVCVYAASSEAVHARFRAVAGELGAAVAGEGWGVVYGGGGVGLMGEVARAALAAGGRVTGIIPHLLDRRELALEGVTELIRTDTLRERKQLMDDRADAFVVLPGGPGTLEELMEILTLRQLGYHDRPIVLLDADGYWDPLLAQFARMEEEHLAHGPVAALLTTARTVDDAMAALRAELARAPADDGAPR